jgi:predicted RNase H-like HicB family nuclease
MKTYTFKVVVEPDEDAQGNPAWHAYCPALESIGAATSGRTREEVLERINQLVQMIVQELKEEGRPLPEGPEDSVEVVETSQEESPSLCSEMGLDYRSLRSIAARALGLL